MVYIKGLKFKGFKSFRRAEASFPKGYVCLAGPNGSGKSNVTDGIRFALGEGSLKALRAKRVAELINTSCKSAEVTLYIDGEHQYEIKRTVNSDGTTEYRLNGKRTTRTLVLEELRQYGLDVGSHNIIAQGQVQKIIEMSSKERRQIIDSVAGISEFDAKKDEALRELDKVEAKITEANIVLGERSSQLTELEKQKNDALSYLSAQESFKRAMASIANMEHEKLGKSHIDTIRKQADAASAKEELSKQSGVLNARLLELEGQKKKVLDKLGASGSREAALAEIAGLKEKSASCAATLSEKKKEHGKLESSAKAAAARSESLKKSLKAAAESESALAAELENAEKLSAEMEKQSGEGGKAGESAEKLERASERIMSLKERKAAAEAAVQNAEKMLRMREEEKGRLSSAVTSSKEDKMTGEISALRKEALAHEGKLEELFSREREINRTIPDLDRRLLACKEKAATLRGSLSPAATSMALRAVDELKSGGMKGIYGTVSSLVSCDPKYSIAVEASAGQRLNYVVVDSADTAIKVIGKLKEQKSGRCTFIPLDMPRQQDAPRAEKAQGSLGALIDFVDFSPAYLEAMRYVFSDTLLFDSVQNAKRAGVGKARMVSLEGDLIEKSGIISGGSQKGSLLSRAGLEKAEAEAKKVEADRSALYAQLYSIRDEMSARRKEKALVEVKLKGIEIEMAAANERVESGRKALEAIAEVEKHIASITKEIAGARREADSFTREISHAISEYEALKRQQAEIQEKAKQVDAQLQKRLREAASSRAAILAKLEGKRAEISRIESEIAEKAGEGKEVAAQLLSCRKEMESLSQEISDTNRLRAEKEGKLAEISSSSQKLMDRLKELDSQVSEVGQQLGKIRNEEERKSRELMELEVRRQTAETRLADLKATLEQYSGVPLIEASRQELEELSSKSRATMDSFGTNVNLQAPQLYDEKKRDMDEIRSRVDSLGNEKKAVFLMMDEIEGRKRAIFISTFTAVNENFQRLFGYVFKGEGTLILEQPSSPFESGLLVKVRDESHEKYLDSMSGGEKSLLALIFIFSIQMHKAAPFYILDEADAALDKENSRKLAELVKQLAGKTQFIVVTHNDTVLSNADVALGVTRTEDGSKIVGVQLTTAAAVATSKKA